MEPEGPTVRRLDDWLLSHGRHWVTSAQLAELLDLRSDHVSPTVAPLVRSGRLFSPARGAYVPIPPEFRSWNSVPAENFIDPLMRHLDRPYYVALLSAAAEYGASHQAPQVFQVATSTQLADRQFGRVRLQFVRMSDVQRHPTRQRNTPSGTIRFSTPEVTMFDLVQFSSRSGGLNNVATIALSLLEEDQLQKTILTDVSRLYPLAVARRAGWLIEHATSLNDQPVKLDALASAVSKRARHRNPTRLRPDLKHNGSVDRRWNLIINDEVEPDL